MSFDPLSEHGIPLERQFRNWSELNTAPYDKYRIHPFTRCRAIVMNGIEVEAVMFSHNMARRALDPRIKEMLALVRRVEQQQQQAVNRLVPGDETTLETTIGYEQVAVDLTAWIAQHEPDPYLKQVYEFGLLEDFDHLYRYANLMMLLDAKKAERIVGGLTEITPGRPTTFQHRDPRDEIRRPINAATADPQSVLNAMTITAAEQQTMNFYMTIGNRPIESLARALYLEIGQIEEQHVTQYESLLDPGMSWFENLVWHEYNECWLYHSFMRHEPDAKAKALYELHLNMEIEHLRVACEMMRAVEGRDPASFLPKSIERPLLFRQNKGYLRRVLDRQVDLTADGTAFVPVAHLPVDHRFHRYQRVVNADGVPTERVIAEARATLPCDYRYESEGRNPVPGLLPEKERRGATTAYADHNQPSAD